MGQVWREPSRKTQGIMSRFKLLTAAAVVTIYLLFFRSPAPAPVERPKIQLQDWPDGRGAADAPKAQAVLDAMRHTFKGYHANAWGADGVRPISGAPRNDRNGWGCFVVDSATTLALMGMWDELKLSIAHIRQIDFDHSDTLVDPFETTIRYLGGLSSLVDLIDTGVVPAHVAPRADRDAILSQAARLARKLQQAYSTPTGMPYPRVNFTTAAGEEDPPSVYLKDPKKHRYANPSVGPARAGSNILEHRALTHLTGSPTWAALSVKAWAPLVWNAAHESWPGLVDAPFDIITGKSVGQTRHWDAGHDSYYEYLIKAAILAPADEHAAKYADRWVDSALSLRKYLASRSAPAVSPDADTYLVQHEYIGRHNDGHTVPSMSHLAHFAPGNLILGGKYLGRPNLITFGQALLEGCHHTYNATATGVGPESFWWIPAPFSGAGLTAAIDAGERMPQPRGADQAAELKAAGFWINDATYRLRPEYVESLFYAWRITGEQRYRDWAWDAFRAIERACRTTHGYAQLADVRKAPRGSALAARSPSQPASSKYKQEVEDPTVDPLDDNKAKAQAQPSGDDDDDDAVVVEGLVDQEESFWAGETLKYLYLTFADVKVGSLDEFVYTTEAHPLRFIG